MIQLRSTLQLLHGDCVIKMKGFASNCIDLTVTSPPYDNLRKYTGFVFDFYNAARELYRITKPGGVVVWVVADGTTKGSETGTSFTSFGCRSEEHTSELQSQSNLVCRL